MHTQLTTWTHRQDCLACPAPPPLPPYPGFTWAHRQDCLACPTPPLPRQGVNERLAHTCASQLSAPTHSHTLGHARSECVTHSSNNHHTHHQTQ
eukprot:358645-Chlamydomonas_euryale.AAC.1